MANSNGPAQTVVAGSEEALAAALERCQARGVRGQRLPVACAFHSPLVAAAREPLARRVLGPGLIETPPEVGKAVVGDSLSPTAPWRIVNIGRGEPVNLMDFIAATERALGRKATLEFFPMQPGDVAMTFAATDRLAAAIGFAPQTPLADGLGRFVAWYREYHGIPVA